MRSVLDNSFFLRKLDVFHFERLAFSSVSFGSRCLLCMQDSVSGTESTYLGRCRRPPNHIEAANAVSSLVIHEIRHKMRIINNSRTFCCLHSLQALRLGCLVGSPCGSARAVGMVGVTCEDICRHWATRPGTRPVAWRAVFWSL